MTKISSKTIVPATENQKIPVSPDNVISPGTIRDFSAPPIESSWTNALGRIGSIIPNQAYKVNNDDSNLPAGVDYILIWGLDAGAYNTNGQAYLTGLGVFPCDYDVIGDKIAVVIDTIFRVTQTGTNDPVVDVTKHGINGLTFSSGRSDTGIYNFTPSFPLSTLGGGIFNEVHIHMTGSTPNLGDLAQPISFVSGYYDETFEVCHLVSQSLDLVTGLVSTDGIYTDTPIYLTCILSN